MLHLPHTQHSNLKYHRYMLLLLLLLLILIGFVVSKILVITAPVLLADYVATRNGLKNGVHCGLYSLE